MRRHASLSFLVVPTFLFAFLIAGTSGTALAQADQSKAPQDVADQQTRFLLFNMTPGGSYNVIKNGNPLVSGVSSFFGVFDFEDMSGAGDMYAITLEGVNPEAPSKPTGLVAVGGNQGCADLSWNLNPEGDVTGYILYFGTESVEIGQAGSYSDSLPLGTVSHHILCELEEGTYYFAIKAENQFGLRSPYSNEASAAVTLPVTQPPSPPQQPDVEQTGPDCITASWQANSEPDIAGYTIYYGATSVEGGQALVYDDSVDAGNATSKEICGLAEGTYYFAVKARNTSSMYSAYSPEAVVQVVPPDETPPVVAVENPVAGELLSGVVTVTVSAGDNVGVTGVQLHVDGENVDFEDGQAPYEITWNTANVADGAHLVSATARDAAGNSSVSEEIPVYTDNDMDANHPQLLLTQGRLDRLRSDACYDAEGNAMPACSPCTEWTRFFDQIGGYVAGGEYENMAAWHFALVYKITKNADYAARAIALVDDEIANGIADERANDYQSIHDYVRDVSLVYDWLYIFLTSEQKDNWIGYMNQLLTEVWNPDSNPFHSWSGKDIDNPGSYRYYQFLLASAYAGLATRSENPNSPALPFNGTDYNDILNFVEAKIDQQARPEWLSTKGAGGGWYEGDYYAARAGVAMNELFCLLDRGGETDYFSVLSYPGESVYQRLYAMQPGFGRKHTGGDIPDPAMTVGDADRHAMLLLADGLEGGTAAEYAQFWVKYVSAPMQNEWMYPWDFLLNRSDLTVKNYNNLPTGYYAAGAGWANSRSGWETDAISLSFTATDHLQEHQHMDQNSFVIFRSAWLGADAATYSATGLIGTTDAHNTILVDGIGQRTGAGTGRIIKYESGTNYTYMVGDAGDAYYQGEKDAGGQSLIDTYQREIVHIKPDHVVVFDRITATDSTSDITWLLHTRFQPSLDGSGLRADNGDGRLFLQSVLPENPGITVHEEIGGTHGLDSWCTRISPAEQRRHVQFLSYLYPTTTDTGTMPPAEAIYAQTGNMVGVRIGSSEQNFVLMFSTDPLGAPPSGGVMYELSSGSSIRNYLLGLAPNTGYDVQVMAGTGTLLVMVREGEGYMTTAEGVLQFDIDSGRAQDEIMAVR